MLAIARGSGKEATRALSSCNGSASEFVDVLAVLGVAAVEKTELAGGVECEEASVGLG